MSALNAPRNTREVLCGVPGFTRKLEIASGAIIYPGAVIAINTESKAVPAADSAGLVIAGVCEAVSGGFAYVRTGSYRLETASGTEALTLRDIGKTVYALDDQTVGKLGGTHHIPAGMLRDVDGTEAVVDIGNSPVAPVVHNHDAAYVAVPETVTADPPAASASSIGKLLVAGSSWTDGTAIATATEGEVYMNNGTAWVKLA